MIYHINKDMIITYAKYKKQWSLLKDKKDRSDVEEANFRIIVDSLQLMAIKIANCCEEQDDHEKSDEIIHDFIKEQQ